MPKTPKYVQNATNKYHAKYIERLSIGLNKKTDNDIIEWLETKENKSGYVKTLIRNDIEKQANKKLPTQIMDKGFIYRGYPCKIAISLNTGCRHGYVGIKKDSHLVEKYKHSWDIECHGGITYETCEGSEDDGFYWIGFDCNQDGDMPDLDFIKLLGNEELYLSIKESIGNGLISKECTTKDTDFCINECKNIVDQLENLRAEIDEQK